MSSLGMPSIDNVVVAGGGTTLSLTCGGETRSFDADKLRTACRCAHCTRARIDGKFPDGFRGVTIETLAPMGHYGVNIAFSDGHARGIYPWSYLAELSEK
jgi:prepilin-type processing-associated H-X9-DG protein